MKKIRMTVALVSVLMLFNGCARNSEEEYGYEVEDVNAYFSRYEEDASSDWIGRYTFEEGTPSVANDVYQIWQYTMQIYEEDTELYANIQVDGFQTMERIHAKVLEEDNQIQFIFLSYLPDNMTHVYQIGDILLTLQKHDADIFTIWEGMQPKLEENHSSSICFEKAIQN